MSFDFKSRSNDINIKHKYLHHPFVTEAFALIISSIETEIQIC